MAHRHPSFVVVAANSRDRPACLMLLSGRIDPAPAAVNGAGARPAARHAGLEKIFSPSPAPQMSSEQDF